MILLIKVVGELFDYMRYIFLMFFFSTLFSSDIKLLNTASIFQSIESSDFYVNFQYTQSHNNFMSTGFQWWPSSNLYLSGFFSRNKINNDKSLFHLFSIGYTISDWFIKSNVNAIELGINRIRFYDFNIYRWFKASVKSFSNFKKINFGFEFSRFFYKKWTENRFSFNVSKSTTNEINYNISFVKDRYHHFTPILGVSISL